MIRLDKEFTPLESYCIDCFEPELARFKISQDMPLRIYVAYRYSAGNAANMLGNIGRAVMAARIIAQKGHYPFVPHYDCLFAILDRDNQPLDWYYKQGLIWQSSCDAICIIDEEDLATSKGVKAEYELANKLDMPIFMGVDEVYESDHLRE